LAVNGRVEHADWLKLKGVECRKTNTKSRNFASVEHIFLSE
jgi:hypothetical protein